MYMLLEWIDSLVSLSAQILNSHYVPKFDRIWSNDVYRILFRDLSFGRGTTAAVKGASIPNINDIEPWDGKDGKPPADENIDLSDIVLDDDDSHSDL